MIRGQSCIYLDLDALSNQKISKRYLSKYMYYFSVEVHDPIFQVEFPFVPSSGNFIILAYNNIFCIKQITRIPLRYVITTTKGIILSPFTFSIFFVSINVVIRVYDMYLIYTFSLSFSSSFAFQSGKFTSSYICNSNDK